MHLRGVLLEEGTVLLGTGFQDQGSPLVLQPAERGRDIVGGTQNPQFRQMSKNRRRFKLAENLETPWSPSQLSPQVTEKALRCRRVGHTARYGQRQLLAPVPPTGPL